MTRLFLAAGVAALAITAPASAKPGNGGGHDRGQVARVDRSGHASPGRAAQQGGGRMAMRQQSQPRQQRTERPQQRQERTAQRPVHMQREQRVAEHQPQHVDRKQAEARQQQRVNRVEQAQARQQNRANRIEQAQAHQQIRRAEAQDRMAARQQVRGERIAANNGQGYGVGGCPPGLADKGCAPPGLTRQMSLMDRRALNQRLRAVRQLPVQQRIAAINNLGPERFVTLRAAPTVRVLDPLVADSLIGVPLSTAATIAALNPLPQPIQYLYPETPNYYYQYGNGYVYQVNRGSNLINALIPLLTGGYMPGSYLPSAYMSSSYMPDYYGYNSFYPSSYGYGGLCNRYEYGVVYQVDCDTGMVENVIPTYAGGYGVGQLLPSSYSYYNVPTQYRSLYPSGGDYGYWYAPGAIYQYDQRSSLITSVAALLSPGFTVGQPLPTGYGVYNVPYAYRSSYYDTANDWYRYNNGYIYRVDPATQLVTAIVASALT